MFVLLCHGFCKILVSTTPSHMTRTNAGFCDVVLAHHQVRRLRPASSLSAFVDLVFCPASGLCRWEVFGGSTAEDKWECSTFSGSKPSNVISPVASFLLNSLVHGRCSAGGTPLSIQRTITSWDVLRWGRRACQYTKDSKSSFGCRL